MRPTEFAHISDRLMLLLVWTARVRGGGGGGGWLDCVVYVDGLGCAGLGDCNCSRVLAEC